MLILNRNLEETITVGDDITVTVLSIYGNHVRLGINAPREVTVLREELSRRPQAVPSAPLVPSPPSLHRQPTLPPLPVSVPWQRRHQSRKP
jgi:carbon storage regulator